MATKSKTTSDSTTPVTPAASVMASTTAAIAASSKSKPEPKPKAAAKKSPAAKKAAAKKEAPAKPTHRTDYKPDTRVKVTRRDGSVLSGRVVKVVKRQTGSFIDVNVGTKQMPIVLSMRPAKVKGF